VAPDPSAPPRVRFHRIGKRFGGVTALDDVSFDVSPGSVHALVGENGAGKSTLMNILAGVIRPDAGSLELDGEPVTIESPRQAQSLGVAIVHQELAIVEHLSVCQNVFLGRWPRGRLGMIDRRRLETETARLFEPLGMTLPWRAPAGALSVAQRQMVEIARALSQEAQTLVLDEPSAVLTPREVSALFGVVRSLTDTGVSVMYISHRLEEVFEIADAVTVLRDGRTISTRPIDVTTRDQLIRETVGRELSTQFPQRRHAIGEVVLETKGLTAVHRFDNVSFTVRSGEVFALTGLVGAGRSSVAQAIFGAIRTPRGSLRIGDTAGPFRSPRAAQRAGIAFVPEDRKTEGLLLERSVRENLTLAYRHDAAKAGLLSLKRERRLTRTMIEEHGVKTASTEQPMSTLSGGNQQKALLARWLCHAHRLVILDEPTRGVDVGAKADIFAMIHELASKGAAVLMVTSVLPEALGMADRIGVMREGKLVAILDNMDRQATQVAILNAAVGEDEYINAT